MSIRILLADDHPVTCAGITQALVEGSRGRLQVEACAASYDEVFDTLGRLQVDVLVTDFYMPSQRWPSELAALQALRTRFTRLPVVVITALGEACALGSILATGVKALLSKQAGAEQLRSATLDAVAGRRTVCSAIQAVLARRYLNRNAWPNEAACTLSAREREVLALARLDLSIRQIATRLGRSERSVASQRRKALDKLALRPDAALWHCPPFSDG